MLPTLAPGTVVLVYKRKPPTVGSIVVARLAGREVIKRVAQVKNGRYYLLGDNHTESTDSREYGPVKRQDIRGTLVWPKLDPDMKV